MTTLLLPLKGGGRGGVTQTPTHIAGLGCRSNTTADELIALIQKAAAQAGVTLNALATPDFKRENPALQQAAALLNLPLLYIPGPDLEKVQPLCPTRSEAALRATGHASIAEAAALAATGGALLAPRIASRSATCAIARSSPPPLRGRPGEGEARPFPNVQKTAP